MTDRLPAGYDAWRTTPPDSYWREPPDDAVEFAERCEAIRRRIREKLAPAIAAGLIDDLRELEAEGGCLPGYSYEWQGRTHTTRVGCVEDLNLDLLEAAARHDPHCEDEDIETAVEGRA